jgi:hypothetical protein
MQVLVVFFAPCFIVYVLYTLFHICREEVGSEVSGNSQSHGTLTPSNSEKLSLPFVEWGGAGAGGVPAAVGMACQ